MKSKMLSSASDIVIEVNIPREKRSIKPEMVKGEELSYRPFVEEIVQEIQFTYIPQIEKKTRKMLMVTNITGQ